MKILFDARVLGNQMHGIARYCLNLLKGLLSGGREHEYLVLISRPEVQELFVPKTRVRFIQTHIPLYSPQEQLFLPALVRREGFDLIHSPSYTIPWSLSGKSIITIHDLIHLLFPQDYGWRHRLYYKIFVRQAVSRCRRVLTVSEHSKRDILRLLKGDPDKITVVPNGLESRWSPQVPDPGFLDQYQLKKGFLLFVGNPRPHKNFERVRTAFEGLVREQAYPGKLVAVGISGGDDSSELAGRIIYFSSCNDAELASLYSSADLLAAPSLYEGFGLPVLEAMACGCPVLISHEGSLPEIAGEAGLTVDPYKTEAIQEGFNKILFQPGFRQSLRNRGLIQAARFSWEKSVKKVLDLYAAIQEGRGPVGNG
jgi:glycosyltransferase involved in cell wall biosynthesis